MYSFSVKQADVVNSFLSDSNNFINILEGSVRSGKTYIANLSWVLYVMASPHTAFLISGESTDSLYRNVIKDVLTILGEKRAKYNKNARGGAQLIINANGVIKTCYCRGGSKSNDEGKIRGVTLGGWYADEITLHHKSFVHQALSRLSLVGSKALWTTNPDSPFHFVKTDYIDKANENNYGHWHFTLEDNNVLSPEYKENIKKAYSGVFYDRFIRGLWVLADGLIYDMFREDNIAKTENREYSEYFISSDYGIQNPNVYLLIGKCAKDNKWYVVDEYYWNAREQGRQKTDEEYYFDLVDFVGDRNVKTIILDPSASSMIACIRRHGRFVVKKGKNDVLKGIAFVSTMIKNKDLMINDCCKNLLKEMHSYTWDNNALERGKDSPVKEFDHCLDALRYFCYTILKGNNTGILK